MPTPNISRTPLQLGALLVGGALVSAEAAWLHMRELVLTTGVICGSGSGAAAHCPACYASVLLFASGAAVLLQARADRPTAPLRARSNPSA
jgi:hypothetical protein